MSQRIFRHGNYEILTGWDRPLQRFLLVIEDTSAAQGDYNDDIVFSNLNRDDPAMSLDEIRRELTSLDIRPPDDLFDDLAADRRNDVGNLRHEYPPVG